jgi:glucan biosynthesis protein
MEYFAGSVVTLITMYIVSKLINHPKNNFKTVKTNFSQSRQNELVKDYIPINAKSPLVSQASKHLRSQYTRIIFINDDAFWLEDNCVYKADFDGSHVNYETKIKVDMMDMDKVELDKMIFVVERLTEGLSNDSGNSGN